MIKDLLIPRKYDNKIRVGIKRDGGYVVSPDHFGESLISVGCENKTSFESEYLKNNPESNVIIYDGVGECTLARNDSRVTFNKKYIKTFSDLNVTHPCMIQMDIEGPEVNIFGNTNLSGIEFVEQLVLEFHFHNRYLPNFPQNGADEDIEKALTVLDQHFSLIHIHVNNAGYADGWPMYKDLYDPIELTYIKKDNSLPLENSPFPIEGLDFPNRPGAFDPKIDWWVK